MSQYCCSFPITVFIGQSQHSLQKTSIILDLDNSKAIYLFTYTKKKKRKSIHRTAEWFGFLNPLKLCANLIKARTCSYTNAHIQTAPVGDCLNQWHSEPYYMLTTHHSTQQTSRQISLLILSLSFSSAPSLSFCFLFHSVWDWGCGLRRRAVE